MKIWIVAEYKEYKTQRLEILQELIDLLKPEIKTVFPEWRADIRRADIKEKRELFQQLIREEQPDWILSLGNIGLEVTTGKKKVMDKRGKIFKVGKTKIMPTISPGMVKRQPRHLPGFEAEIRYFIAKVMRRPNALGKPEVALIKTKEQLYALRDLIKTAELISFDIETRGDNVWAEDAAIVSLAVTLRHTTEKDGRIAVAAIPLDHPESPWRKSWQKVLKFLKPALESVPKTVAHNGKFDCKWLLHWGVHVKLSFDTMIACHLLDENRQKGLKIQALTRLGVTPWALDTRDLWSTPIDKVLEYNALDTFYTYHIYKQVRQELIDQPRLLRIFTKLLMPAHEVYMASELRGIWVDPEKLESRTKVAFDMRQELENQLMQWVPTYCLDSEHEAYDPDYWPTNAKGKPLAINFNPSNFARWWLFEHLGLPVLAYGKTKENGDLGAPSMAEAVMLALKPEHEAIRIHLERSKWQKYCSTYFSAYQRLIDENHRIHTNFKLFGTVTGRTSSGKEESDKVSGKFPRSGINLQQTPRDYFVRGLFGAEPGWVFAEADFSQVELRVIAFISRDPTMMRIYQTGGDIHIATAMSILGKPADSITKEERKKIKAVNFGFGYGMGAQKFVLTAFEKYELVFSLEEAKAVRKGFFDLYRGLLPWHARMRRLVNLYGRVQSPIGRVRHLPDIFSEDEGVKAEAERQAINSPVQSFASDMTLLAMVLINQEFKARGLRAHILGTVHDSLLAEIKEEDLAEALPIIKHTMENLPLRKKFGCRLDVPIVADLKVGRYWSEDAIDLTDKEVYNWNEKILQRI